MSQFGVHWVTSAAYCANLRDCAPFERKRRRVSFIQVVQAANIAPVVVTVGCLGSAEFEKVSGGSLRLASPKMLEASRRQSSIC
jgi:hypothetical protein